ncbi:MAG: hypothetical protein GQ534_04430 [Candidatus Delongbacteria bacterium]|nr:hypothetical protein [Candidatus Delongbacteria bacterium]
MKKDKETRIILFEGQPGSGKTTLSTELFDEFVIKDFKSKLIDEYKQDTEIFGDYWDTFENSGAEVIESFVQSWKKFLAMIEEGEVIIMDNALLNQVQYLMSLNTSKKEITKFFVTTSKFFEEFNASMVFMDGDSDKIIRRINESRRNGWGERVSKFMAEAPYQKQRNRIGIEGMVEFFSDSQVLKREILNDWLYPIIQIDVTDQNWEEYKKAIRDFVFLQK